MGEARGWHLADEEIARPLLELEAGERIRLPLSVTVVGVPQVTVRLRGMAGGREHQRDKLVTITVERPLTSRLAHVFSP